MAEEKTLLKVDDIHVYYGSIHAIKGVSFDVNEGEIVTLIGANGAGKSTTLNTIAGLLRPRQGTVELNGTNINGVSASKMVSIINLQQVEADKSDSVAFRMASSDVIKMYANLLDETIDDIQAITYSIRTAINFGLMEPEAEEGDE